MKSEDDLTWLRTRHLRCWCEPNSDRRAVILGEVFHSRFSWTQTQLLQAPSLVVLWFPHPCQHFEAMFVAHSTSSEFFIYEMSFCLFVSPHDCWWKWPFYPPFTNQPSTVQSAGHSLDPWIPWANAECSGEADPEEGRVVDVGYSNSQKWDSHWDTSGYHPFISIYIHVLSISIIYLGRIFKSSVINCNLGRPDDLTTSIVVRIAGNHPQIGEAFSLIHPDVMIMNPESLSKN